MPISKKRKKHVKKKTDYNKNKINKVIKTYSKLLDNYIPALKDLPKIEQNEYNLNTSKKLGTLTLNPLYLSAAINPILNNKDLEKQDIVHLIRNRINLMLALHIMLDIMPDDVSEGDFLDKLKYYYGLIGEYYDLSNIPTTKNLITTEFYIKD